MRSNSVNAPPKDRVGGPLFPSTEKESEQNLATNGEDSFWVVEAKKPQEKIGA